MAKRQHGLQREQDDRSGQNGTALQTRGGDIGKRPIKRQGRGGEGRTKCGMAKTIGQGSGLHFKADRPLAGKNGRT